jgi:hypothetical protein
MFRDRFSQFHSKRTKELILWAAVAAAAAMLLSAPGAFAEDQDASSAGEAALPPLPEHLARVPSPPAAPPVNRTKPKLVHVTLEASRSRGF